MSLGSFPSPWTQSSTTTKTHQPVKTSSIPTTDLGSIFSPTMQRKTKIKTSKISPLSCPISPIHLLTNPSPQTPAIKTACKRIIPSSPFCKKLLPNKKFPQVNLNSWQRKAFSCSRQTTGKHTIFWTSSQKKHIWATGQKSCYTKEKCKNATKSTRSGQKLSGTSLTSVKQMRWTATFC